VNIRSLAKDAPFLPLVMLVALLVSCVVWAAVQRVSTKNRCRQAHCDRGAPTYFYRENLCLCMEVPR
jgi:hypothetical protein